jgi:hypothetical protein
MEANEVKPLTNQQKRLIDSSVAIQADAPDRTDFLHAVMCQVGMPRRATDARVFERQTGSYSLLLQAGAIWDGKGWVDRPLPYGTTLIWEANSLEERRH